MFSCKECNYTTKFKSNLLSHQNSKKHKLSINNKSKLDDEINPMNSVKVNLTHIKGNKTYKCEFCDFTSIHGSSYSRHKTLCKKSNKKEICNDKESKINNEELYTIKELKLKMEFMERENRLLNDILVNANNVINKTTTIATANANISMSALKYANEKFKNAPALLPIQNFNINNLDFNNEDDRKQLVEILIYNAKQKSLDKLLGDHIVKEYKKEKPEEQMFHTTDCSRLNYIVRQLMEDALIWSVDKSGIEICSSIIKPLIKKCIDTLMEHQKYLLKEMGKGDLSKQKDVELIISILMSIDSGNLETDINKYIAPYFNLDKN